MTVRRFLRSCFRKNYRFSFLYYGLIPYILCIMERNRSDNGGFSGGQFGICFPFGTRRVFHYGRVYMSVYELSLIHIFGTAHRAHCSNVGVTKYMKENAVGYLMQKEIDFLGNAVEGRQLEADFEVAKAKGNLREIKLYAQVGFTGTDNEFNRCV